MRQGPVVVACREPDAQRLAKALEAESLPALVMDPARVAPRTLEPLSPRVLILETGDTEGVPRLESFWEGSGMEDHLPILVLHPPHRAPLPERSLDEPVDLIPLPAGSEEVVARVQGLQLMSLLRLYRKTIHDLSQPITIARAFGQKAMKSSTPSQPGYAHLVELNKQVERIFRIVETLHLKRHP